MNQHFPNPCEYPELLPAMSIADMDLVEGAMGPGRRLAIWMQGCRKRCLGCVNPDFLPLRHQQLMTSEDLLARLDAAPGVEGVSLSGGEPILQAAALIPFLAAVHDRNLSVICYTGYDLTELIGEGAPRALSDFLAEVDLLIAGPFRQDLPRAGPFLESANQRLHFLSARIRPSDLSSQPAHVVVLGGGQGRWTGPLPASIYQQLEDGLRAFGVKLGPAQDR
jgi:anaerobic ribonucleoside-triphosphate reductase activating protein